MPAVRCWRWTIASVRRVLGGAVLGKKRVIYAGVLGFLRTAGPTLSAFNAWVILKGLETLSLRVNASSVAALELAQWLEKQSQIERVYYPGLPSHPQHALALRQQRGFGGVMSFELEGYKNYQYEVERVSFLLLEFLFWIWF